MSLELLSATRWAEDWLQQSALPLWSTRGFDRSAGLFEEQLSFDGRPVLSVPRRLMVQSRQISVFSAAYLSNRHAEGRKLALTAAEQTIASFLEVDGRPGWVFSIDRSGAIVADKRDLYAHSFAMFALAWVMRVERRPSFEAALDASLEYLDREFADTSSIGYWDCLPREDTLRRQNPHMHLFEALIALFETTRRPDLLARAGAIRDLALSKFINPSSGALREYYYDDWTVYPSADSGSVEPGHLFEWAWLLRRWQAVTGNDQSKPVASLLNLALSSGLEPYTGRIVDEITENGSVRRASSRSWGHAEALKALCAEIKLTGADLTPLVRVVLLRLLNTYCREELKGGWIDHFTEEERPSVETMPASSLYHLYFGIEACSDLSAPSARAKMDMTTGE